MAEPKTVMDVLGPAIGAAITGSALLLQGHITARRDAKTRREAARLDREREERALAEVRRREMSAARTDWAAAFQEALTTMFVALQEWRAGNLARDVGHSDATDRIDTAVNGALAAQSRARVATAKLLTVESDGLVRTMAKALTASLQMTLGPDGDTNGKESEDRLAKLASGLESLTEFMAGLVDDHDEIIRTVVAGATIAEDERAEILKRLDERAKKKAALSGKNDATKELPEPKPKG